jgi:hypothetical protein
MNNKLWSCYINENFVNVEPEKSAGTSLIKISVPTPNAPTTNAPTPDASTPDAPTPKAQNRNLLARSVSLPSDKSATKSVTKSRKKLSKKKGKKKKSKIAKKKKSKKGKKEKFENSEEPIYVLLPVSHNNTPIQMLLPKKY